VNHNKTIRKRHFLDKMSQKVYTFIIKGCEEKSNEA